MKKVWMSALALLSLSFNAYASGECDTQCESEVAIENNQSRKEEKGCDSSDHEAGAEISTESSAETTPETFAS